MSIIKKLNLSAAFLALGALAYAGEPLNDEQLQATVLAGGCAGCHGTDGKLSGLPGRSESALERQLLNFKYERVPSTVMARITKGFTDEEISALARYFAHLETR